MGWSAEARAAAAAARKRKGKAKKPDGWLPKNPDTPRGRGLFETEAQYRARRRKANAEYKKQYGVTPAEANKLSDAGGTLPKSTGFKSPAALRKASKKTGISTGAKRALSLMANIKDFDESDRSGDAEIVQRRAFALQRLSSDDIFEAAFAVSDSNPASAIQVLEDWAGHMDSRNHTMMNRLLEYARTVTSRSPLRAAERAAAAGMDARGIKQAAIRNGASETEAIRIARKLAGYAP